MEGDDRGNVNHRTGSRASDRFAAMKDVDLSKGASHSKHDELPCVGGLHHPNLMQ